MNLAELTKKLEDFAKNELKAVNVQIDTKDEHHPYASVIEFSLLGVIILETNQE